MKKSHRAIALRYLICFFSPNYMSSLESLLPAHFYVKLDSSCFSITVCVPFPSDVSGRKRSREKKLAAVASTVQWLCGVVEGSLQDRQRGFYSRGSNCESR